MKLRFNAKKYADIVGEYFKMWNGLWWQNDYCVHDCTGEGCCEPGSDVAVKMGTRGQRVFFQGSPGRLAADKWNKMGDALDWILCSSLPHGMLGSSLLRLGLDKDARAREQRDDDMEQQLLEHLEYAVMRGTLSSARACLSVSESPGVYC